MSTAPTFKEVRCVGMFYRGDHALTYARNLRPGATLYLERDPDNAHDANAIKTMIEGEEGLWHLGYIDRNTAAFLSFYLIEGWTYNFIVERVEEYKSNPLIFGRCEPQTPPPEDARFEDV